MFGKGRRERERLEQSGKRAPATVVEIARFGLNIGEGQPGRSMTVREAARMATLRVQPDDEPEFEVRKRIRFGRHGRSIPKAGDRIEVIYDPEDHEKIVVAPPTAEEERARSMAALRESNLMGGGSGGQVSDEFMKDHQEAMAQAQQAQELMQKFGGGGGGTTPAAGSFDTNVQLAQLQALRDGGALSEEDFEAAKKRLLGEA